MKPMVIDGHLDLAYNVICGRDLSLEVATLRAQEARTKEQVTVTLPELKRGRVAIAFATLFALPTSGAGMVSSSEPRGYTTPEEAEAQALAQLAIYERWAQLGLVRLVHSKLDLEDHLRLWELDAVPGLVVLMEGADPILDPRDLSTWWSRGVRIIGPAWGRTRYSGGTRAPGGLSELGRQLIADMNEHGFVLDVSHMSEESFFEALEFRPKHVIASHSNARALTPTDRHLSDEMIRAIGERDAVIGLVLGNPFLEPRWREDRTLPVTLTHVQAHAEHIAKLIGWEHVGIGSDLDGGFGLEETPRELNTIADLESLGNIAPKEHRDGFLGLNWLRLLRQILP